MIACSCRDDSAAGGDVQYSYPLGVERGEAQRVVDVSMRKDIIADATSTHHAIETPNIQASRVIESTPD